MYVSHIFSPKYTPLVVSLFHIELATNANTQFVFLSGSLIVLLHSHSIGLRCTYIAPKLASTFCVSRPLFVQRRGFPPVFALATPPGWHPSSRCWSGSDIPKARNAMDILNDSYLKISAENNLLRSSLSFFCQFDPREPSRVSAILSYLQKNA